LVWSVNMHLCETRVEKKTLLLLSHLAAWGKKNKTKGHTEGSRRD